MKRIYLIFIFLITGSTFLMGQQIPVNNNYMINKFSLSPAYAGFNNNIETFVFYRQTWAGIDGAPELKGLMANGSLTKSSGFGATIMSEKIGIFRSFTASLSYAYHLKLGPSQSLRFGLSGGIFDTDIDISSLKGPSDPAVMSNTSVNATMFDVTFGILYTFKKFNFGVAIPRMIESTVEEETSGNILYTMKRQFNIHLSYNYLINSSWQVEPIAVVRNNLNAPMMFDVGFLVKYKQQMWLSGLYRKGSTMGIGVGGAPHDRIVVNYGYEFSGSGIHAESSGTHEISIGILIGENSGHYGSIFRPTSSGTNQPYLNWE